MILHSCLYINFPPFSLYFPPESTQTRPTGLLSSIISLKKRKDHDVNGKFYFPFTSWSYFFRATNMVSYYLTKELDTMKNTIYRAVLCALIAAMLFAGIHASTVTPEENEQITLCILDDNEVSD